MSAEVSSAHIKDRWRSWLSPWLLIACLAVSAAACRLPSQLAGTSQADGQTSDPAQTSAADPGPTTSLQQSEPSTNGTAMRTATASPTPTASLTPTPATPIVQVSGATHCRVGPGEVYGEEAIMNADQSSEILGVDPSGNFYLINNPDDPGQICWIWNAYATPQGPVDSLPLQTPPPTPTPNVQVTISLDETLSCWGSDFKFEFRIRNTGAVPLESVSVSAEDTTAGSSTGTVTKNEFYGGTGCHAGPTPALSIPPGGENQVRSDFLHNVPYGHNVEATVTVCTQDGLGGVCRSRSLTFTP